MDYKDIRLKFAEISGRYDLITATYEDNGADFFLNAGQKYLDRFLDAGKAIARYPVILSAGEYIAKSVGIRAIKEVWIANSEGKTELTKCTLNELKTYYDEEFSSITQGAPSYYAPAIFRPIPDTRTSISGMYNVSDLLLYNVTPPAQHFNYDGIVLMPPCDGTYTIEIVGLFYSPTLVATLSGGLWTQSRSYWTEVHPEILLEAAMYKMNVLYNNTGSAVDHKASVVEDMLGIDHDAVEEDIAGSLEMGG